jgi:F0F1-type ATP synthase membrane subunit c/vacuolar-type H+-ATPase subunit K
VKSLAQRAQLAFIVCVIVRSLLIAGLVLAMIVLFGKRRDTG